MSRAFELNFPCGVDGSHASPWRSGRGRDAMTPPQAVVTREGEVPPPPGSEQPEQSRRGLRLASDERLAKRAGRGDPDAFAAIFRRYEHDLYRFCVGILGEPQDAQDAIQNTMLKVMRALPGERREIQLKPWLYRIAHNEAIELRRRQRPVEPLEPAMADAGLRVDESAERSERLRVLFRDMTDLPQRQRAALVMRELNGLEFGEIGAALDTSPSAVRQALYEARRGLQQMELGRHMDCDAVTRVLSDEAGRPRGRDIRAHLRHCSDCRRFRHEIAERKQALAAISPLPPFVAGALLKGTLAGSGGGGAGAGASGGVAASVAGGSAMAKSVAGLLAVVALGGGAADRSGLVALQGERPDVAIVRQAVPGSARSGATATDSPVRAGARGPRQTDTDPAPGSSPSVLAPTGEPGFEPSEAAAGQATGARTATTTPRSGGSADPSTGSGGPESAAVPPLVAPGHSRAEEQPAGPGGGAGKPSHSGYAASFGQGPRGGRGPKEVGGTQAGAEPAKPHASQPGAEEKQARSEARADEKQANAETRAADQQARAEKKEAKSTAKAEASAPKGEAKTENGAKAPKPAKSDADPAAPAPAPAPAESASPPQGKATAPAPEPPAEPATAEAPAEPLPGKGSGTGNDGNGATKKEATTAEAD